MPDPRIDNDVDLHRLQSVLGQFAEATGLTIHVVDHCGRSIAPPLGLTAFGRRARASAKQRADFQRCEAHAGLQATIQGEPTGYLCHTGLASFAIPFSADESYSGAVLCGQAMLLEGAEALPPMLGQPASPLGVRELEALRTTAPQMDLSRLKAAAATLSALIASQLRLSWEMGGSRAATRLEPVVGHAPILVRPSLDVAGLRKAMGDNDLVTATHSLRGHLDELFDSYGSQIHRRLLDPALEALIHLAREAGVERAVQEGCRETLQGSGHRPQITRLEADELLTGLLFRLHSAISQSAPGQRTISDLLNQIERAPTSFLTLDSAARYLSYSPHYLSRVFKAHTGLTFIDYVTNKRMAQGKLMLAHSELPVLQIAARLAFKPANYFSRAFKQNTGLTPSQFRDRATTGTARVRTLEFVRPQPDLAQLRPRLVEPPESLPGSAS